MKNKYRVIGFVAVAALVSVAVLLIRHYSSKPETAKGEITVGVVLPQTGILAEMGQYERQAMEMAADDLKASGQTIRLIFEDGKGDNKTVAAATNKLLDIDGVRVLVTSTTSASFTAQPIAARHGTPHLAFCMSSDLAPKSPNTIRFYVGIEEESKAVLKYLETLPADAQVGVMHGSVAAWTEALRDIYRPFFERHFQKPVIVEEYDIKSKDFRPQLTKLKSGGANVLILLGYGFEYRPLFTQMQELGLREKVAIVGGWGFLYTGLSKEELEDIHVAGPTYVFDRGRSGSDFESRFQKRFGYPPNFDAAFAYEMVHRIPELLATAQRGPAGQVKGGVAGWGIVEGVMGKYHFTSDGNMVVETSVGQFRGGVLVGK